MLALLCAFAVFVAVARAISGSAASAASMRAGDVVAYSLSVALRITPIGQNGAPQGASDSTASGNATVAVARVAPNGTAHANLGLDLQLSANGKMQRLTKTLPLWLDPGGDFGLDGAVQDESLLQYFSAIGEAMRSCDGRPLHVGDTFTQQFVAPGAISTPMNAVARVVGQQVYHGYPAFAIQETGNGSLKTASGANTLTGTFSVAGTTYCDQRDRVVVGRALRVQADVQVAGASGGRFAIISTQEAVLHSLKHATPKRKPPVPIVSAAPVASPPPTESPVPTPSPEYYTPTPPVPTPSPVVNPYPPPPTPQQTPSRGAI